jgi:dUTP pyrophosphatase
MRIDFCKLDMRAIIPSYATHGSAGMDLVAIERLIVESRAWGKVRTGLAVRIPEGYEGQIRPRSGLAARYGVTVLNSPGTIDSDYRGEILVLLVNHGRVLFEISAGDRIAQLVICPVAHADVAFVPTLDDTDRGAGGFGSTGR